MSVFTSKSSMPVKDEFVYPTNHLQFFDELFDITSLFGDEYKPIIKTVWYSLISTKIATKSLAVGKVKTDGRIHPLIFLKSGHGKGEIKRTIKLILSNIDKTYVEPTSFHSEQFVGKVLTEKNKKGNVTYRKIHGHLNLDYVIIDEGKNLLTGKDNLYTESRRYLRMALDPYPNNEITKKAVDIEHHNALKYSPFCCVCIFLQPQPISEEIVLDGDFRRFIVPYIMTGNLDKTEKYLKRLMDESTSDDSLIKFTQFLNSLNVEEEFIFSSEARDSFGQLLILLINRGKVRSAKIMNYMDIADYTIQNTLLKFSVIQALQENTNLIEPKHVELAFLDYSEILEHTYDFIENKILGSMNYGDGWSGAIKKDQEALKWLLENDATSLEDSEISIKKYKEKIMEIFHIQEKQAQRKKKEHEENGWIESKKGQHDSKVWLAFEPNTTTPSEARRVRVDMEFKEKCQAILENIFEE